MEKWRGRPGKRTVYTVSNQTLDSRKAWSKATTRLAGYVHDCKISVSKPWQVYRQDLYQKGGFRNSFAIGHKPALRREGPFAVVMQCMFGFTEL